MSPDVGRGANLSGPSMVKSAGDPDDGAGDDDGVELEAQDAEKTEAATSKAI